MKSASLPEIHTPRDKEGHNLKHSRSQSHSSRVPTHSINSASPLQSWWEGLDTHICMSRPLVHEEDLWLTGFYFAPWVVLLSPLEQTFLEAFLLSSHPCRYWLSHISGIGHISSFLATRTHIVPYIQKICVQTLFLVWIKDFIRESCFINNCYQQLHFLVHSHDWLAAIFGSFTDRTTGRNTLLVILNANWHVQGTDEKSQVWGAFYFN